MFWRILVVAALLPLPALAASGMDENLSRASARTRAICERLGEPRPPATDLFRQPATSHACSSESFYYGEGVKRDYTEARRCAFEEQRNGSNADIAGTIVLMQLYANGFGVKRDPDLATAYSCRVSAAPADHDTMVESLQALKTKPAPFDYCDMVASSDGLRTCAGRTQRIEAARRAPAMRALSARVPEPAQPLFEALASALTGYIDAHLKGEMEQTCGMCAGYQADEESKLRARFAADVNGLLSRGRDDASHADLRQAEAALASSYRQAQAHPTSGVTADGIAATQRAWQAYRRAFVVFARAVAPRSVAAFADTLVSRRTEELRTLHEPG